jgi:hypothetical protein
MKKYLNGTVKSLSVVTVEVYMTLILVGRGVQIKKCICRLEILGSRRVIRRKFHTKGPKNVGRHSKKKCNRHGDMLPGICAL